MKRLLIAMGLVATVASFSSCKKTEVTQIIENTQTIAFTPTANSWLANSTKTEYQLPIDMPELDQDLFNSGSVLVYVSTDNTTYDALPATIGNYVFTTFHQVGKVTIDVTFFDGKPHDAPGNFPIKVMLIRAGSVSN